MSAERIAAGRGRGDGLKIWLADTVSVVLVIFSHDLYNKKDEVLVYLWSNEGSSIYLLLAVSLSPPSFLVLPSSVLSLSGLVRGQLRLSGAQISG